MSKLKKAGTYWSEICGDEIVESYKIVGIREGLQIYIILDNEGETWHYSQANCRDDIEITEEEYLILCLN